MRTHTLAGKLLLTMLVCGTAGMAVRGAEAASLADPCAALSVDQVGSALGKAVGAPEKLGARGCQWTVPNSAERVTLLSSTAAAYDIWKKPVDANVKTTPVSGVGDEAILLQMMKQTGLLVKKGDNYFKVQVYSPMPDDQKEAAEKKLAAAVAAKL